MNEKKLGLGSVVATGVGLIVATSCLLSLGAGSSAIGATFIISMGLACVLNILMALCACELNAVMPNLTGGLAQYSLASVGPFVTIIVMVGGYLVCNTVINATECAMFGNTIASIFPDIGIPSNVYCVGLLVVLIIANLFGVDMFAKIQNVVAYGLIGSLTIMGLIGMFGLGSGEVVDQPLVISSEFGDVVGLCGLAFFLFIGCEYVIPIAPNVDKAKKNIPLGMIISLVLILVMQSIMVFGFHNYTPWEELGQSATPHVLYGAYLLGDVGIVWMAIVSILAVTSSVNTILASLSYVCAGMAKIELLPKFFGKTNKYGTPYIGLLFIGGIDIILNLTGLSTSDSLTFFILIGCVFWMAAYILTHINVLILRYRLPKAPRTFKVPMTPIPQILGIIGTIWMIWNIDSDPSTKKLIYMVSLAVLGGLIIYSWCWVKIKVKRPMFKPYPVKDVMAMENELYGKAGSDVSRENKEVAYE